MKIYGDMISPYVRMCFVTAHEAGIGSSVELVPTDAKISVENEELACLSPIAQIPVLVTADGSALHDSRVIVEYICHAAEKPDLAEGVGGRFRRLTLQAIALGISDAAVAYRNEIAQRPQELHWHQWLARMKLRVEHGLDAIEQRWQPELAEVDIGSISVAVTLSYLDFRFDDWSWRGSRPRLAAFHERFSARPSMVLTALSQS